MREALVIVWFALGVGAWIFSIAFGMAAVRRARTKNRLGRPVGLTLYVEPEAFTGTAAVYRRVAIYSLLVFLVLVVVGGLLVGY
jgi:hypothetical protein